MTSIVTQDYINNVTTTETVDYDAIGNPTTYRGATLAFNGRQLTSYTKGSTSISYQYDASGLRASKTVNGNTTIYQYVGDKLYYEARPDGSKIYYFYDSYGNLTHLYYHVGATKTAYNVVTNSQGDVIALYNFAGTQLVASYEYDAWGNCTITQDTTGIGAINPIRYRGYYYDSEIGMYYLQSRYYDPSIGRFINADGYITTGQGVLSYNMYAYCMNNPVMMVDYGGYDPGDLFDTMDEAAEDAAVYLGELSFENCWEYSTAIIRKRTVTLMLTPYTETYRFLWWTWTREETLVEIIISYKYTYEVVHTDNNPMGVAIPDVPWYRKRVATLHTHPMGSGQGITKFSDYYKDGKRMGDIINAENRGIPSYVYGPDGVLLKYNPKTNETITVSNDLPTSPYKPWEK